MRATVTRVVMNRAGAAALLKSPGVLADLQRRANAIAGAAGEGFEADARIGAARARASVHTASTEARVAEATDRALTRAIDAGRG